jgi:hypothetical protein
VGTKPSISPFVGQKELIIAQELQRIKALHPLELAK